MATIVATMHKKYDPGEICLPIQPSYTTGSAEPRIFVFGENGSWGGGGGGFLTGGGLTLREEATFGRGGFAI